MGKKYIAPLSVPHVALVAVGALWLSINTWAITLTQGLRFTPSLTM
jgi:hypothetical protein